MSADLWADVGIDPCGCPVCGRETCEDHLPGASAPRDTTPRLRAQRACDVIDAPRPVEIIEGVAYAGCLSVLASESGTGKTFALLAAGAAVSDGVPWHGRDCRQGSVVYVSYEGDALGLRLRALHDVQGHRLDHVYIIRASDPLSPLVTRDGEQRSIGEISITDTIETLSTELATAARPPIVLIVIDTVRASLSGSEDSSEHVAAYLRAVRRLMAAMPGAACILAHHSGWQDGDAARKRERGSSAWRGNCDATLYLEAGDYDPETGSAPLTLRSLKVRDAERPAPLHLMRRRVELAELDRSGNPVTSCVIESDRRSREDREAEAVAAVQAETQDLDLRALRAIADRPELATSQDRIRLMLGIRKALVGESLARLLRTGWVLPGRRGQPYELTERGRMVLAQEKAPR